MNNHASRSLLKVDSTCLKIDAKNCLIVYNINVPTTYTQDKSELKSVLERIRDVLMRDFKNLSLQYQITASYMLRHTETGETKTWTGSFIARNNSLGVIADFQSFSPTTFVENSMTQLASANEKLKTTGFSTKWKFDQLLSIIFNIECRVSSRSSVAANRKHRGHQTFPL